MGLRTVALPLLAVAVATAGVTGAAVRTETAPLAAVRGQAETGVPEDLSDEALDEFDFSSVFVDLTHVGAVHFDGYRYGDTALESSFLGALDTQVGGFVVPGDDCDPAVVAPFVDQELRAVVGTLVRPGQAPVEVPVALVAATVVDPDVQADPAYAQVWRRCLALSAEETTDAAAGSLAALPAFNLYRQNREAGAPVDLDLVSWSEEGLEILVFSTFALAQGGAVATYLATAADTVEPGLEIARAIAARTQEPTDLLLDEAYAPPLGFSYGPPVPGAESRVRRGLRDGFSDRGVEPASDPTVLVPRAQERAVLGGAGITDVQVVVWEPSYLNRPGFRTGWLEGLRTAAEAGVSTESREGARVFARYSAEGRSHAAWVTECYTVTVVGTDAAAVEAVADAALLAQQSARLSVFGITGPVVPTDGDADDPEATAEAQRDERNQDLCAPTNLRLFQTGFPVDDPDGDGIAARAEDA